MFTLPTLRRRRLAQAPAPAAPAPAGAPAPAAPAVSALPVRSWGTGPATAVLVHGMLSESRTWWRIGPALAARGYRVLAVDLPGHGEAAAHPDLTMADAVDALCAAVPARPDLLLAHSMGAFVAAAAYPRLQPRRVVYVDTPFGPSRTLGDPAQLVVKYQAAADRRTPLQLAGDHPDWHPEDRQVEASAAAAFDPATSVALLRSAAGHDYTPTAAGPPTLMIRSQPSRCVPDELADRLRGRGWEIRDVPGADHLVWHGHLDGFLAALDGWLQP